MKRQFALVLAAPLVAGCSSLYYGTMEKLGVHKREILVERVEEGREAQEEAKEQFASALEAFRAVQDFEGGELEDLYDRLRRESDKSERRAHIVRERIDGIAKVADALFGEWEAELDELETAELRRQSEELLEETRGRYRGLLAAMRRAESRMDPVLSAFRDHVLFLKHNLNARAIASLQGELRSIETDVDALIRDVEAAIAEADAFLAQMA